MLPSPSPISRALTLSISALATYRLTKLVVSDEITASLRERVFDKFGGPDTSKVAYLVSCPHCVSVYAGLAVSFARMIAPRPSELVLEGLALSAVTGIMAEREDSF